MVFLKHILILNRAKKEEEIESLSLYIFFWNLFTKNGKFLKSTNQNRFLPIYAFFTYNKHQKHVNQRINCTMNNTVLFLFGTNT